MKWYKWLVAGLVVAVATVMLTPYIWFVEWEDMMMKIKRKNNDTQNGIQ